jgi:hypothetical protein
MPATMLEQGLEQSWKTCLYLITKIELLAKFPRQHGCWRAWLLSPHEYISLCHKHIVLSYLIFIMLLISRVMHPINRACAFT